MSSMKKTKEGINLKKLLRLKNTGSIFVIAGLLTIFVIASYTFILQSSYTKTALETEITRDTASADAVHKLVDGRIGKEHFDQIKLFTEHALWDAGMLEFALETAAKMGRTEILSYLMNEKQKSFPTVRKEFRL